VRILAETTLYSHFCYKPSRVWELEDSKADRPIRVRVEKIIELTWKQYQYFSTHLLRDMPFIAANRELAGRDPQGVSHCLLVSARNRRGGILVDCQGYNYARYAAYVPDTAALDLRDVPVEHYNLKLRQPRDRRER